MLRDHPPHGAAIDVANHDYGHEVGTIPIAIEPHQLLTGGALDDLGSADRRPVHIARAFELDAADLVRGSLVCAQVHPPLGKDDGTLAFDAARVERGAARPVLQDGQRAVEGARHVGWHAERVLRFVEARFRIRVRADAQSERAEKVVDALSGKMRGALELHVLDEVRQPSLIVVFKD